MSIKEKRIYGRRKPDNGWRAMLRTWGLGGLLITTIFAAGGMATVVASNAEDIKTLTELQRGQAELNGSLKSKVENTEKAVEEAKKKLDDIYKLLVGRER